MCRDREIGRRGDAQGIGKIARTVLPGRARTPHGADDYDGARPRHRQVQKPRKLLERVGAARNDQAVRRIGFAVRMDVTWRERRLQSSRASAVLLALANDSVVIRPNDARPGSCSTSSSADSRPCGSFEIVTAGGNQDEPCRAAGSHGRGRGSKRQNEEEERADDHVPDAIGCALRWARPSHSARVRAARSGVVP